MTSSAPRTAAVTRSVNRRPGGRFMIYVTESSCRKGPDRPAGPFRRWRRTSRRAAECRLSPGYTRCPGPADSQDFWLHLEVRTIRRAEDRIKYRARPRSAMAPPSTGIISGVADRGLRDVRVPGSDNAGSVTR